MANDPIDLKPDGMAWKIETKSTLSPQALNGKTGEQDGRARQRDSAAALPPQAKNSTANTQRLKRILFYKDST
jgi:hypothetical protein